MTEIAAHREMTRTEVAEYLREFATQLDPSGAASRPTADAGDTADGRVTFVVGDDSATINPPEMVGFGVAVESDSGIVGSTVEREVGFELTWEAEATEDDQDGTPLEIR